MEKINFSCNEPSKCQEYVSPHIESKSRLKGSSVGADMFIDFQLVMRKFVLELTGPLGEIVISQLWSVYLQKSNPILRTKTFYKLVGLLYFARLDNYLALSLSLSCFTLQRDSFNLHCVLIKLL